MKSSLLLLAAFGISLSMQEGYYHKQYQYKSSSSSYKNNELQHKTDDEEFSSVHGDLAGRDDPKVNSYAQHTEYRNPNTQDGQQESLGGTQMHGSGRYQNLGYSSGNPDDITGSISGQRKHISYSGSYMVSGGQANQLRGGNYDTQSNLLDLTQKVQNSLSGQLSRAISDYRRVYGQQHHSAASTSTVGVENEIQSLEDELRTNLTRRLQEELNNQYGSQTRRGSYSYSSSQTKPNYNTQELDDLTQQVQTNLIDQLRREYQTQSSSSQSSYSASSSYGTNQKTYNQHRPTHQISSNDYTSRAHTTMYRQETPTVRPSESLVDVTSKAQMQLDIVLNAALSYLKTKYMNDDTYKSVYQPDYDIILNDLTAELRRNITMEVDNALRNAYGLQEEKNGYYFSTWNVNANVANYRTEDLDNLKKQVEKNLLEKLTQEVRNQKSSYMEKRTEYQSRRRTETQTYNSWNTYPSSSHRAPDNNNQYTSHSSQSQYSSSSSYGVQQPVNRYPGYYPQNTDDQQQTEDFPSQNSNRFPVNTYPQVNTHDAHRTDQQQVEEIDYQYKPQTQRPSSYIPRDSARYPTTGNSHSSSHTSSSESSYQHYSGNRASGLQTSQLPTAEISRIQEELNRDLSQQVQRVIQQQHDQGQVYSSSQTNQAAINDLTEEFKQNFSRRVEEVLKEHGVRGGYSFMITSTGSLHNGQNNDRFTDLTSRLQEDLLRQLREGLSQQSFHSSSSSSSSSSRSYQPIRYSSTYGSGASNSAAYSSGSYGGHTASHGTKSGGYGTHTSGYGSGSENYDRSGSYVMQSGYRGVDYQRAGECCMQSDEAPSSQTIKPPRARADIPVDLEVEPLERDRTTEKPKARDKVTPTTTPNTPQSSQSSESLTQEQTQKLEQLTQDISRQIATLTQNTRQNNDFTNQQSSDLTQQTQNFNHFDQQTQDLRQHSYDLTQQTEDLTQKTEDLTQQTQDLTQQTEDLHVLDLHHFDQQQSSDLTQQTEDLIQQSQDFYPQSADLTQQTQDLSVSDLTQKTEDDFGQQTSGYSLQSQPSKHANDIIKQTEDAPQQQEEKNTDNAESENATNEMDAEVTTERKGFWKKLGGKISSGLNTVKDKLQSIG